MSFNNRNMNPNIWDAGRHNNPQPFINNNQQNFYGNNLAQNFPRPNFHQHQNTIRPLLNIPPQNPGQHDHFRNFNNRGRPNYHNQQKWQNRGNDNKDSRFNDSRDNSFNNNERSNSEGNDDNRPKSLVEQLKSTMKKNPRSKSQENTNESIDQCAKNASKKLLSQLKTMDKDNVKELINNPKQPHRKAVMNIQAREKLREGMRKQLNKLGADENDQDSAAGVEAAESVNYENIPETLIAQIGRTVDMDLSVEDMDLQQDMDGEIIEDKDIEVVKKNLGNDFLYGSEMLLMNGFNLLGESENESELKINEDRFFPPPLPAEPVSKPPEPVPPPDLPNLQFGQSQSKPPPPPLPPSQTAVTSKLDNDWEFEGARNPDPPETNAKTQTIPVIVSHPVAAAVTTQQIVPPSADNLQPTSNISKNNVLSSVKHENPLLIPLTAPKVIEQASTTPKSSTNQAKIVAEEKIINKTLSQDSFKTPSIPDHMPVTSTPFTNDSGRTPFIGADDSGKTPFIGSDDGGKTPIVNAGDESSGKTPTAGSETKDKENAENQEGSKLERKANETYGEYRRRLAGQQNENEETNNNINTNKQPPAKDPVKKPFERPPPPSLRKPLPQVWDESPAIVQQSQQNEKSSWITNNNSNNNLRNNSTDNRKSRFEMNRSRDRNNRNNNNNSRNRSRDRNNWDNWNNNRDRDRDKSEKPNEMKDAFNYRFENNNNSSNNNNNSHDGSDIDRLNNLLNPKPVQFKGSFNKRSGYNNSNSNRRSRSRERTPANNSIERDFANDTIGSSSFPGDVRPCYHTLKKIMEIESELTRTHDKIHGIDKVISNLQSERIGYQKQFTKLQHDKKILLDNLIKRTMQNENSERDREKRNVSREREKEPKEREIVKKERDSSVVSSGSNSNNNNNNNNTNSNKKVVSLEPSVSEQKKRRIDNSPVVEDDSNKKKKKYTLEEEPKSAAQKAKEKEEEERRKRIEEIRKQKQLRREKEESERRRLEEEAKKESNDTILIINRNKDKEINKKKEGPHSSPPKVHKSDKNVNDEERGSSKWPEYSVPNDVEMKMCKIKFEKMSFAATIVQQYQAGKCPEISMDELKSSSMVESKIKSVTDLLAANSMPNSSDIVDKDPLGMDDNQEITNPPTPGSNLTLNDSGQDYSEWTGNFESHDQPIVHIQNIDGKYMVCAAEDGKLYKYLYNGTCEATFDRHTEICNSFLYDDRESIVYTASSDGYVYRIKFKMFDSVESKQLNEPLQVIEKSKHSIYVGAKSGNIFKLKMDLSDDESEALCCVESLILCMRYTKEGSRHILLISSRMNAIQVRDANDGLLLRTLSDDLTGVSIYDMILEGSTIYCGSNLHEIFALDFTTGALIKKRSMSGAGAICVRIHKEHLIVACYDGNIYIFNLNSDDDAVNITGPSNMLLAMDLWNDKIIASTKDKTLKIMSIPT